MLVLDQINSKKTLDSDSVEYYKQLQSIIGEGMRVPDGWPSSQQDDRLYLGWNMDTLPKLIENVQVAVHQLPFRALFIAGYSRAPHNGLVNGLSHYLYTNVNVQERVMKSQGINFSWVGSAKLSQMLWKQSPISESSLPEIVLNAERMLRDYARSQDQYLVDDIEDVKTRIEGYQEQLKEAQRELLRLCKLQRERHNDNTNLNQYVY
jgi:hypothetical protein